MLMFRVGNGIGPRRAFVLWLIAAAVACAVAALAGRRAMSSARADTLRVELVAAPDGGIQPQAVIDAGGTLHLIYYKGDPAHGDLYYVRRGPGSAGFSAPIRVN